MAASSVMSGARAQVVVDGQIVGIFNQISWNYTLDLRNIDILGRFSTAAVITTGMEPVEVSCSGYRAVGAGPQVAARVPRLQDLLTVPYIELTVIDRASGETIAKIHQSSSSGYSTSVDAKGIMTLSAHYRGLLIDDESVQNVESSGASSLPPLT